MKVWNFLFLLAVVSCCFCYGEQVIENEYKFQYAWEEFVNCKSMHRDNILVESCTKCDQLLNVMMDLFDEDFVNLTANTIGGHSFLATNKQELEQVLNYWSGAFSVVYQTVTFNPIVNKIDENTVVLKFRNIEDAVYKIPDELGVVQEMPMRVLAKVEVVFVKRQDDWKIASWFNDDVLFTKYDVVWRKSN